MRSVVRSCSASAWAARGCAWLRRSQFISRRVKPLRIVRRPLEHSAAQELAAAGVPPTLARIYAARGVRSIDEVEHDLARLPSWSAFKGIEEAAKRLADAVTRGERILIIADY